MDDYSATRCAGREAWMLKRAREAAGISQRRLSAEADVPVRTIQHWEARGVADARAAPLARVARVLGVGVEELLGAPGDRKTVTQEGGGR